MSDAIRSAEFAAFGSTAFIAVTDPDAIDGACGAVQETIAAFDQACSRFRDDSELSALNDAAGRTVRVSPLLLDSVSAAMRAAQLTDGAVDPTVGRALIALGYDRDFEELTDKPTFSVSSVPGWYKVRLDVVNGTIALPRGVRLDLGATAKALAADRAAADAGAAAGCGVLVSFGGDMAMVGSAPPGGWLVRVTDDHRAGVHAPGQWVTLDGGGLATSSTTVRRWRADSQPVHHLVDPATGRSADSVWRTASVAAKTCLDANIASTAAIVRGTEAASWLQSLGLPSRLVGVDGCAQHLAGWPSEGDDLE